MEFEIQRPFRELKSIISKFRHGSPATRNNYMAVIKLVIKDLYFLSIFFNSILEVNLNHVNIVIDHWKKKKIASLTIGSRVSILRKYFLLAGHTLSLPSNKELGLSLTKPKFPYKVISEKIIEKVQHKLTKLILSLQVYLGLTKAESLNLRVHQYQGEKNSLFIPKSVSHNNKDRLITLSHQYQEKVVQDLLDELDDKNSLVEKYERRLIVSLYNSEIALVGESSKFPFRSLYAKNTYQYLLNEVSMRRKEAIDFIAREMGIVEQRLIRKWVRYE